MLAISGLSNKEIIAAYLRYLLPGLTLRLAVLLPILVIWLFSESEANTSTFLYYAAYGQQPISSSTDPLDSPVSAVRRGAGSWRGVVNEVLHLAQLRPVETAYCVAGRILPGHWLVLASAVLSTAFLGLHALIAISCLLLLQLGLGRGVRSIAVLQLQSLGVLVFCGAYAWLTFSSLLSPDSIPGSQLQFWAIALASLLQAVSSVMFALSLARDLAWLRQSFWFWLGLWAAVSIMIWRFSGSLRAFQSNEVGQQVAQLVLWAWGSLGPVNPLAVPAPLIWGQVQNLGSPPHASSVWLSVLLFAAQFALLRFALSMAEDSVAERRKG
jgi:hypothetical protein